MQDGYYAEGWVGNIEDGDEVVGIKVSNAETDTYKVKPPLGTWCQGLGGNSIKCSTEHYTVMEHVLTCHETDSLLFRRRKMACRADLSWLTMSLNCADAALDDELDIIVDNVLPATADRRHAGVQMDANDNTTVFVTSPPVRTTRSP